MSYLWIEVFQDNQVLFDIIITSPFGVVTSWDIHHFRVFATIQTDNGLTAHEIGHVMKDLNWLTLMRTAVTRRLLYCFYNHSVIINFFRHFLSR